MMKSIELKGKETWLNSHLLQFPIEIKKYSLSQQLQRSIQLVTKMIVFCGYDHEEDKENEEIGLFF